MANLFGKECGSDIYNDKPNDHDPCSKNFSLRKNYILVGDQYNLAYQVKLDPVRFEIKGTACDRKMLTLKPIRHSELLGLDQDDHLQYVHISNRREISANHLFTSNVEFSADPLFSRNPSFTGNPVFSADPLFTRNPVFTGAPLFSGNPLFTGDPEFRGSTLFSGPVTLKDFVLDRNELPGNPGQLLMSVEGGVEWRSTSSENVYWVSKSGSDSNDGLSETTAKLTIKSALELVHTGDSLLLQYAANIILANKKLIQEESLGYLMTETNLDEFSFPQEVDLDVKAQAARKLIYASIDGIVYQVIDQISSDPDYNDTDGKCERDLRYITRLVADDLLWGGYEGARKAALSYFNVEGEFISSIFTSAERALMSTALTQLSYNINFVLETAQPNYFTPLKTQVTYLIDNIKSAIQSQSLDYFPSASKDKKFKETVYYARFDIARDIWNSIKDSYPTLNAKKYKEEIRNIAIAIAEDTNLSGNKNVYDSAVYYLDEGVFLDLTERGAAVEMFTALEQQLQSLVDSIETTESEYDYVRDQVSGLTNLLLDSINSQTLEGLPDRDGGNRNTSVKTCGRDIGYFIDAIASDLKNGGNANTVDFVEAYYRAQNLTYIDGELSQTLQTLDRARSLMMLAVRGWVLDIDNNLFQPYYSFEDIFIDKSVTLEPYPGYDNVEQKLQEYWFILDDVFNNSPRVEYRQAKDAIFSNINDIIEYAWTQTVVEYPTLNKTERTCKRDLGFIVEAIAEDVYRSRNTNMIEATAAYFDGNGALKIDGVVGEEAASVYAFNKVRDYINTNLLFDPIYSNVNTEVTNLVSILTTALTQSSLDQLPAVNQGTWGLEPPTFKASIVVKSGVYTEDNPLNLPASTAIIGDDLRSTTILAKNRVFDLFHVNNGSKISNITFSDHLFPSAAVAFPELNGQGTAGIISRSPYIQNCTSKTMTGAGMRVDGRLAQGFKSMVLDSYTQYNQGGIGVEIINKGYAQLVSLFTINCDIGISTKSGGQCDLNNSNVSFGNYAMVADGVSEPEFFGQVAEFTKAGSNQILIKGLGSTKPYNGQVLYFGAPYFSMKSLKIINPGQGYLKAPTITIQPPNDGPLGTPARARATLFNGKLNEVFVLREGRNYTTRTPSIAVQPAPFGGVDANIGLQMAPIFYTVSSSTDIVDGASLVTLASPLTYDVERGTSVPFSRQSRILASSITLEYVGSGTDDRKSLPTNNGAEIQDNEVDSKEGGSVIFTSTDQSGNFRIGDGVIIDQTAGVIGGVSFSRGLYAQITPLILALQ